MLTSKSYLAYQMFLREKLHEDRSEDKSDDPVWNITYIHTSVFK